ncbi:coiled-coil domain-containing protein 124-like [Cylas formicarius]|uniref:coiled-coil domain-containing protein 124-like n=1 Tax=Cylas formicarius TaxID=197179 RepID=UPI002958A138|nr:coiled-coil domain-containing protein 124-like [Cylas formicarius]
MPKKFSGHNSKAALSNTRKNAAKEKADQLKEKELEDAKWENVDQQTTKKCRKKDLEDRKRQDQLQRRAEAKALLLKETDAMETRKPTKITKAQTCAKRVVPAQEKIAPLEENLNRLQIYGEEARGIDQALRLLGSTAGALDMHPEKRLKAAYLAFEEKRLSELKREHTTLRLSQLKQMVFKEWQKSEHNPLSVQKYELAFNKHN